MECQPQIDSVFVERMVKRLGVRAPGEVHGHGQGHAIRLKVKGMMTKPVEESVGEFVTVRRTSQVMTRKV